MRVLMISQFVSMAFALVFSLFGQAHAETAGGLSVEGARFVVETADGRKLTSEALVGAVFEIADGQGGIAQVRIDRVFPAHERPDVLLHELSTKTAEGTWVPSCDPDAEGRKAGFPMRGRWEGGRFVADDSAWFLTCTSGSRGKCVLWGYDPWKSGPNGEPLADFYRACQQMVRADYAGSGEPHTRNGTTIDVADALGMQKHDMLDNPAFAFEAGWGVDGAVCVARTRWPDLISLNALLTATPRLGGPCDEQVAKSKGALLFTRVEKR